MNQEELLNMARERARSRVENQVDSIAAQLLDEDIARLTDEANALQNQLNEVNHNIETSRAAREVLNQPAEQAENQEEVPAEAQPEDIQG